MLNENESHSAVGRHGGEEFGAGFQTAGRCADPDDGEGQARRLFQVDRFSLPDPVVLRFVVVVGKRSILIFRRIGNVAHQSLQADIFKIRESFGKTTISDGLVQERRKNPSPEGRGWARRARVRGTKIPHSSFRFPAKSPEVKSEKRKPVRRCE
jgi:hypothetical protein